MSISSLSLSSSSSSSSFCDDVCCFCSTLTCFVFLPAANGLLLCVSDVSSRLLLLLPVLLLLLLVVVVFFFDNTEDEDDDDDVVEDVDVVRPSFLLSLARNVRALGGGGATTGGGSVVVVAVAAASVGCSSVLTGPVPAVESLACLTLLLLLLPVLLGIAVDPVVPSLLLLLSCRC